MRVLLTFLVFISYSLFSETRPNIVIILTDDLGWGDVSYHGGFIPTPNIDQLADDGIELKHTRVHQVWLKYHTCSDFQGMYILQILLQIFQAQSIYP